MYTMLITELINGGWHAYMNIPVKLFHITSIATNTLFVCKRVLGISFDERKYACHIYMFIYINISSYTYVDICKHLFFTLCTIPGKQYCIKVVLVTLPPSTCECQLATKSRTT